MVIPGCMRFLFQYEPEISSTLSVTTMTFLPVAKFYLKITY